MNDRSRPPAAPISSRQRVHGAVQGAEPRAQLFRTNMMRRGPAGGANQSSTSTDPMRLDAEVKQEPAGIVVRDQHGEIELGDPPSPILDGLDDLVHDEGQETEKERQRLTDAVNLNRINQSTAPEQVEEVLESVRASLRAKVSALAEDNWMFEPEEQPRS